MPGFNHSRRKSFLSTFTDNERIISRLIEYLTPQYAFPDTAVPIFVPLDDEPAASYWSRQAERPAAEALRETCPELAFPLQEGINQTDAYRSVVFRGETPPENPGSVFNTLQQPNSITLKIQQTGAGLLPVFAFENYDDFLAVFIALSRKNEPCELPQSMGAALISGYNNWNRFREAAKKNSARKTAALFGRSAVFADVKKDTSRYKDSIVLLSKQPYSDTPASRFNLSEEGWLERSLQIRLAHESTHYIAHRLLGGAHTHLHDELIADYIALSEAFGCFSADAFLDLIGCGRNIEEGHGRYRLYTGGLEEEAERVQVELLRKAAENLERFEAPLYEQQDKLCRRVLSVLTLSAIPLDSLASDQGEYLIRQQCNLYKDMVWRRE